MAALVAESGVEVLVAEALALRIEGGRVTGLHTSAGVLRCRALVIATGTFLDARIFVGDEVQEGGRRGERASGALAQQVRGMGLSQGRLKTGTPPRLDGRTIDWSCLEEQPSDLDHWTMSSLDEGIRVPQLACAIARTNGRTHEIIRSAFDRSPLFAGAIEGRGPRYCPSIEDKVKRFADRDSHQIFLEPEGLEDHLVYPNGVSTSLPADVQRDFLRSVEGLERVEIVRPGYAVEYEFVDPRRLRSTLETTDIAGLFLAGQINGTTGYEEAAAQGLAAGLNAAAHALALDKVQFDRRTSYIGVMIDDLTLQGVSEPYRMMTARAEYRSTWSNTEEGKADFLYAPYLERQEREWEAVQRDARVTIPAWLEFASVPGISTEMAERLEHARPETLDQASRIRGVTPAALSALYVAASRRAA
jgi:tRNA uridine 5-carboxymethylaminomethyl modification enzyme